MQRHKLILREEELIFGSVDVDTESVMQDIISSEFRDCTVISVMHRLRYISRYDRVALLDEGRLSEYGEPEELKFGNTMFAELCNLHADLV